MPMRTLLAPGTEIFETDRSQYSPAMVGSNAYVMGFTNAGEAYTPMEFTSRAAWTSYYGTPDNEAERYAYAAACEVLNQGGHLYFARLPYDNASFEKAVGFKYKVDVKDDQISESTPFFEIHKQDDTVKYVAAIEPTDAPALYDLSVIDEFRTEENKVANNTFLITDITYGTYGKIPEDDRKNEKREMIGIMPVITTAANAIYAQSLIDVDKEKVIHYETIGNIRTLNASDELSGWFVKDKDVAKLLNTSDYFTQVDKLSIRVISSLSADVDILSDDAACIEAISAAILSDDRMILSSWDGKSYQISVDSDLTSVSSLVYSCLRTYTKNQLETEELSDEYPQYADKYGWHGPNGNDDVPETLSREANSFFPTIGFNDGKFDRDHLKKIGVVVYKMFKDASEGNKINFEPVEAYAGSLFKDDKDPVTGMTTFIDTIINSQSKYINFFSNCFNAAADKKDYKDKVDMLVVQPGFDRVDKKSTTCPALGFYSSMTKEDISISKSIYDGMNKCFDKVSDIIERDIDIVPDAGIASIASYLKAIFGDKGEYDLGITDDAGNSLLGMWKVGDNAATKTWKAVEQKLDTFCKQTRKDCMFIADAPRPFCLAGQKKIIRSTKPSNTIDKDIVPNVKWIMGLDSSYGAGYCDWFEQADDYSGDLFWCPPSIKAMGVYINTDLNYNYWDAPAGMTRGVIAATDVAFSPSWKQAGPLYEKNWNYAINYPDAGIVLEGQKTLQSKTSAFDRVNVRRLFLRLERMVFKVSRQYIYEGHSSYVRQRFVDSIDPYFKAAKAGGGISDYKIICDETNNTDETIDRNELHVSIGIKPQKTIEWILANFICLRTGASWEEAGF